MNSVRVVKAEDCESSEYVVITEDSFGYKDDVYMGSKENCKIVAKVFEEVGYEGEFEKRRYEMKVEVNKNFIQEDNNLISGKNLIMITPPINEKYWLFRVKLFKDQSLIAFPKFLTLGIGFAQEEDWNTNLPYTCDTEKIFNHIKRNKKYKEIPDTNCIEAIKLLQTTCKTKWEMKKATGTKMKIKGKEIIASTASALVENPLKEDKELKTLKDLWFNMNLTAVRTDKKSYMTNTNLSGRFVSIKDLRQEIIKHIKALEKKFEGHKCNAACYDFCPRELPEAKIEWIKYFFNLK